MMIRKLFYITLIIIGVIGIIIVVKSLTSSSGLASLTTRLASISPTPVNSLPKSSIEEHQIIITEGYSHPDNFKLSIYAENLGDPRVMRFDDNKDLIVSLPNKGQIIALIDENNDGFVDQQKIILNGLNKPHGFDFHNGYIYVAEVEELYRYIYDSDTKTVSEKKLIAPLPPGGRHTTRYVEIGPDNRLYVSAGSTCDVCIEEDPRDGTILVMDEDGSNQSIYASGLRNAVYFTFNNKTSEMYATEMGRDWLGNNLPPDEVNIINEGGNYGWPFCYGNKIHDQDFDKDNEYINVCPDTISPFIELPAHVAPLGIKFYNGDLLISYHGSWNSTVPVGYKVVKVPLSQGSNNPEDFITGFMRGNQVYSRPAGIVIGDNNDIYISDDKNGTVLRLFPE